MRIKLAIRYTAISSLILLIVMTGNAILHIDRVEDDFVTQAVSNNDALADILLRDNYHLMLEDDREQLQLMINEVGQSPRIERVRILGKEGIVSFSSHEDEIGTALGQTNSSCVFCHPQDAEARVEVPIEKRSRVFTGEDGQQYLSVTRGIYNEPSCYTAACHAHKPEEKKIGVLDMVVSLAGMAHMAQAHHVDVLISTAILLLILSLGHYLLTQRYICQPIQGLLEQTRALSEGHLKARFDNPPADELGDLGRAFNAMAENLEQAQGELKDWGTTMEQKVAERTHEIEEMQAQLVRSAKLASMGEMVAGIAHEINNPLTGILMFASLSSKQQGLPVQVQDNLNMIVSETGRCSKIVRGLLQFARESIPEKKRTSINQIIVQSLELVAHQTLFQDVEICYDPSEDMPEIEVDIDQIQQVLFNMFVNACQAMPGGGQLTIATRMLEQEKILEISVQDSGTGIAPENLDRIFDPFFSTKAQKGTGLGLSVSYGIIRNHGGTVDVHSREGEGTRFTIHLPLEAGKMPLTRDED
jgi:two-component system NtrC family sensor kinase